MNDSQEKCLLHSVIIGMMDRFEAKRVFGNDKNACISMAEDSFVNVVFEQEGRKETKKERLLQVMDIKEIARNGDVRRTVNRAENE